LISETGLSGPATATASWQLLSIQISLTSCKLFRIDNCLGVLDDFMLGIILSIEPNLQTINGSYHMRLASVIISGIFMSGSAFANCADLICTTSVNGKTINLDIESCSFGTQPSVSFTGTDGNVVNLPSSANGKVTILSGYWFSNSQQNLQFVDDGGGVVFDLEMSATSTGFSGPLTASLPNLTVNGASVNCPNM
jgi:hypothetical protein